MKKKIKSFLLVVGTLIFILIFYLIGIEKLIYQITRLNLFFYMLSIICFFGSIFLWTLRWKCFFKSDNMKISTFSLFKNLIVGLAVNNLTPVAKLGGEPIRIYILKKKNGIPVENGIATVLADLTVELITSSILVIISMLLITFFINPPIWLSAILVVFSFLTLIALLWVFGIYSNTRIIDKIILWVIKKIKRIKPFKERILDGYKKFQKTFRKSLKNKNIFTKTMFLGFLMKIFDILKFFLIFLALGYQINLVQIIIAMGIGVMLMSIPATPGNLGIFEGGMISAFILIGIPLEISATAVFLERIVSFWGITILGISLGTTYGIKNFKKTKLKEYKNIHLK